MKDRVEKLGTGRRLKDLEGKLYPEVHSVVIHRVDNPHVARDTKKAIAYYKKVKERNKED